MKRGSLLLGWLGATALLFALLSFLLQLLSGVILLSGFDFWFCCVNAVVGALLLGVSVFRNLPTLRRRAESPGARRAGRYGGNLALQTLLSLAILCALAFLATEYPKRFDWTEAQSHSLSSQTLNLLDGLEAELRVVAIYQTALAEPARDFLERYRLAAPERVVVEFVDPNAQPGRLAALDLRSDDLGAGLLHLSLGAESTEVEELSEQALTSALLRLTRLERKRVVFLEGHLERAVRGRDADAAGGFGAAAEALRNENYQVDTLLLATTGEVQEDVDVLIVASPIRPFHEIEHAALRRYMEGGGALLLLLDPRADTDLDSELEDWGVVVGDDIVVDQIQGLIGRATTPFADAYSDHPITRALRAATLFHTVRSVDVAPESSLQPLVRTGDNSWAERDLARLEESSEAEPNPEADIIGRVPVMVGGEVAFADGKRARLVVVGDSDFASNRFLREFAGRDLFVNSVNWLLGDAEAISIRPEPGRASRLELSQQQYENLRILALFALPEALAILGVAVWWRRRAPGSKG